MLLNRQNKVTGIFTVSLGGIAGTVADPKLIFGCALKAAASGIILAHNHPSGCLQASHADIDLTKKLRDGGKLLDIQILDHIIITGEAYFSFADEGSCS
jgi:DNA repair protein RadC